MVYHLSLNIFTLIHYLNSQGLKTLMSSLENLRFAICIGKKTRIVLAKSSQSPREVHAEGLCEDFLSSQYRSSLNLRCKDILKKK